DGNARPRKSASELPSLAVSQGLGDASRELEGVLYKYSSLPLSIQLRHASALIRAVVPRLFALSPTGSVHELFLKVWDRLHSIMPRHISACTVNSMRSADEQTKSELTVQDLWLDPLVIFRCDRRVFDHPPLTKLFLGIVREFLAISWVKYRLICTLGQRRHDLATPKFGSTNASALVQLQEAASIQM
ncbi:Integrator complex subunit 2, partial [Spiromyces aspiralis]